MSECKNIDATAPTREAKPKRNHLKPLKMFEKVLCNNCPEKEYCNTAPQQKHLCILALIGDELTRLRQSIEQRSQHQSW